MYAIVEIAGQQFKVEKKQEIFVHRLEGKEGSKVEFSDVLLIDNNGKVNVGTPSIKGATVSGKILEHLKGDKVLVFKKKRRKGYQKLNGHRDQLTKIVIENILEKAPKSASAKASADKTATAKAKADKPAGAKKAAPKSAAKKSAAPKAKADKPAAAKASADKPAAKKPAAKKPAAKKPAAKKPAAPKTEAKPKTAPKAKKAGDDKKETK